MPSPFALAKWEGLLLLGGFFGIVAWKLANGSISLDQLFEGDLRNPDSNNPDGYSQYVSAGRIQSFWVTIFVAFYYLSRVVHNPTGFPKVPYALIGVLGCSQGAYLIGKAQAMFVGRLRDLLG